MKVENSICIVDLPNKEEQMSNFSEINTSDVQSDVTYLMNNADIYSNSSLLDMYNEINRAPQDELEKKMKIQVDSYSKENIPNCHDVMVNNMQNCTEYGFIIPAPNHYKDYTNWYNKNYIKETKVLGMFEDQFSELFDNHDLATNITISKKKEIKEFIWKHGSISKYRYFLWCLFSNKADEDKYNSLLKLYDNEKDTMMLNIPDKDIINNDLLRTFPNNIHFMKSKNFDKNNMIESLEKQLSLFSMLHKDDIGYCQSLNYICGLVILISPSNLDVTGINRHKILDSIVSNVGLSLYDNSLSGLKSFQETLLILIFEYIPDLFDIIFEDIDYGMYVLDCILDKYDERESDKSRHNREFELPVLMIYLSKWVLNCFINILPIEHCLKIIDIILISDKDGIKWINKITLTLLDLAMDKFKYNKSYRVGKPESNNLNFESRLKQSLSFKINKVLNKDFTTKSGHNSLPPNLPSRKLSNNIKRKKNKSFTFQSTNPLEMEFLDLLTNLYQPELYTDLDFDNVLMKKLRGSRYNNYDFKTDVKMMLNQRMTRKEKLKSKLRLKKKD
ncbi:hypothetical protein ACO0R3_000065 [Hanseniaspora guilliermondii]